MSIDTKIRLGRNEYALVIGTDGFIEFMNDGVSSIAENKGQYHKVNALGSKWLNRALDSLNTPTENRPYYKKPIYEARTDEDLLSQYPPPTISLKNEIELKWSPMDDNLYAIRIFRNENAQYYYRELKEQSIKVNLASIHVPSDICLYWTVSVVGSNYTSKPKCIYLLNLSESSNIEGPAYFINEQADAENSPVGSLMLALYYESHKVQAAAEDCYYRSVKLTRGGKRFHQIHYNFLSRRNQVIID